MKYISFSLWGDNDLYTLGCLRNSILIKKIYPDWKMVVYYNDTVNHDILKMLDKNNVLLINMTNSNISGPFWRFLAVDLEDCEYTIFRDCDSRVSLREKLGVDEWINSGLSVHVIRDHPAHKIPFGTSGKNGILAGMWGIKSGVINMLDEINRYEFKNDFTYGYDQTFLVPIYEKFINDMFVHDEFFGGEKFPIKRDNLRFIGERIGVDEQPLTNDHLILKNYE